MYYSDEIYHHGIKGQRWCRRNGPPYPLSHQTHASVVRSAGRGGSDGSKVSKKGGKIGKLPEHLSGYREVTRYDTSTTPRTKGLDDRNMSSEDKAARRRRIAKGVAIGAGVGALALGGAIAAKGLSRKYAAMSQKALTRANTRANFVNKYDTLRAKPLGDTNVLIRKNQAIDLGSKKGLAIRSMKLNQGKRYANLAYNTARKSARLNNLRRLGLATAAVAPVASTAIAARRKKKKSSRR